MLVQITDAAIAAANTGFTPAGIVAIVLGILTIAVGVPGALYYYKNNPKMSLDYWVSSVPLVSQDVTRDDVEITAGGVTVPDPVFTEITVYSNSRADIESDFFDSQQPLTLTVTYKGTVILDPVVGEIAVATAATLDKTVYTISPQLIKKKSKSVITFISSGPVEVARKSSLKNIPFEEVPGKKSSRAAQRANVDETVSYLRRFYMLGALGLVMVYMMVLLQLFEFVGLPFRY
ncbi:hypothetical protein C5B99_09080 [Pseudoclavibacter sp. Z016]|nr:hypothetical protein C5B99_09080 [Pseudoclavibacter sp. Z016]